MTNMNDAAVEAVERKRMDAIWWAGAFIWIGLALGAEYLDILPRVGDSAEWWPWIFIGIGPWALVLNVYRQTSSWPSPLTWDWIWTAIFLLVGLGAVMDIGEEIVGAVALVVVGVILMGRALSRRE